MKKIRIGIIGMGRMGITHFSIINSHPSVEIVAVADTSNMIVNLLNKYIDGIKTYKSYENLLNDNIADAILVCTPPNLHFPIIKAANQKNLHVFVEKPFTAKKQEAHVLYNLFNDNTLVNQVGYVNRFNDVFKHVKKLISDNIIGDIIRFKSEMFSCTISRPDDGSGWRSDRNFGGGAVFEMAAHAIDLVNYLIGKPDKIIGSSLNNIYSKNVEDAISSTFLYKKGLSGTIYINWSDESYRKPTNKFEVFGSKGKILADQHSIKIFMTEPNIDLNFRKGWNTLYITDIHEPVDFYVRGNEFTRQLYHFVDCILGNTKDSICSFKDGFNTIDIIDQIFTDYEENATF